VAFAPDCIGEVASEMARQLESGQVLLLENLRYHAEEEANDPAFSKALASLADVYVNDAFGSAHRAHASTEGITHFLKPAVAGLLMEKEITYLGKALESPEKPFVAIIGGSKISGKIDVIDNLLDKVDTLVIVGGMAYTFQRALGVTTGKSLVEEDKIDMAKAALDKAKAKGVKLLLPVDNILADNFAADAKTQPWDCSVNFPADWQGLDIGPKSIAAIEEVVRRRDHRLERPGRRLRVSALRRGHQRHRQGRRGQQGGHLHHRRRRLGLGHQPGRRSRPDHAHLHRRRRFSLEFLEGKKLPGVEALTDKYKPQSGVQWLAEYLEEVNTIYAFQHLQGAEMEEGGNALHALRSALWERGDAIIQADGEGFTNEEGFHIVWQFSDSVSGPWNMGVLQDGTWHHFKMDLGDPDHREAFLNGEVPEDLSVLPASSPRT
jgi:phosphoglycerate kinase